MRFDILGPLEVYDGDERVPLDGPQQQALLAILLVHANQVVSVDRLVDCLWGESPPATARGLLQGCVAGLRRTLRAGRGERVLTRPPGYQLVVHPGESDLDRFASLAAAGQPGAALECWRGPAFDGVTVPVVEVEAARLAERRLTVLEARVDADLRRGCHAELVPELRATVAAHPFRERLWEQLIRTLTGAGRRGDALAAYEELRQLLVEHLGVEPDVSLRQLIVTEPAPPWHGPRPHLSVLVGRDRECGEVGALVRTGRLVTVVGVGGVGKSSLALAVAADLADKFADGVTVVPLAQARDVRLGELVRHLAGRQALLVLDDCEHVAAECAAVVRRLLGAAVGVTVLVTSRRPLGLAEENVYPVGGLPLAPAVDLFARRAGEARPGVELDAVAVTRICERLDGLPLALELAATRLRALPLRELAERLADDLGLLSAERVGPDPRHHTLTAAVEWSYRLLNDEERLLLARLSVFRAGFTTGAVEAVCADPPLDRDRVVPLLSALVDHSVVAPSDNGEYHLPAPVREFAAGIDRASS